MLISPYLQDLVVGAPYEGQGVVYLYQGGPSGLNLRPSQIVRYEGRGVVYLYQRGPSGLNLRPMQPDSQV